MPDRTVISFDMPNNREIVINRLIPLVRREDWVVIEDRAHLVRSSTLEVDPNGDDLVLRIRLRNDV